MSDEQRSLFRETQAVMSLLEGFSDYIMDEVGRDLVPGRRADQRPLPRPSRAAQVGLRAGDPAADRDGPEARAVQEGRAVRRRRSRPRGGQARSSGCGRVPRRCPREGEIEAPERWLARVMAA